VFNFILTGRAPRDFNTSEKRAEAALTLSGLGFQEMKFKLRTIIFIGSETYSFARGKVPSHYYYAFTCLIGSTPVGLLSSEGLISSKWGITDYVFIRVERILM
jgi:hypothetical protein